MLHSLLFKKQFIYLLITLSILISLTELYKGFSEVSGTYDYFANTRSSLNQKDELEDEYSILDLNSLINADEVQSSSHQKTLHVLNCIHLEKGKTGIVDEWEVNFKSVLGNAPLDNELHIHVLANGEAAQVIERRINESQLVEKSKWRNKVTLTLYNVEGKIEGWREFLKVHLRGHGVDERVSIGGYFRLFASTVLKERGVDEVIYMDTDVVVVANLNDLVLSMNTTHVANENMVYQFSGNSGFMVLNMQKFHIFWDLISKLPEIKSGGDQALLSAVIDEWPSVYNGKIPEQWDVHLGHGFRRGPDKLLSKRNSIGMLHFTGAYGNTYFEDSIDKLCGGNYHGKNCKGHLKEFHSSWGLAETYIRLPWKYLIFFASTKISHDSDGHAFQFDVITC